MDKKKSPKNTSSHSIHNIHIEDDLIHIKRFKGIRGRLELYIHNQKFKNWLKTVEILLPQEECEDAKRLTKKILFYDIEYGLMLQSLCQYLFLGIGSVPIESTSSFLSSIERDLRLSAEEFADSEDAWEMAYMKITKKIKVEIVAVFG